MVSLLMAGTGEPARTLIMPPVMFGITAIVIFGVLLAVTYAFRNVGRKH